MTIQPDKILQLCHHTLGVSLHIKLIQQSDQEYCETRQVTRRQALHSYGYNRNIKRYDCANREKAHGKKIDCGAAHRLGEVESG